MDFSYATSREVRVDYPLPCEADLLRGRRPPPCHLVIGLPTFLFRSFSHKEMFNSHNYSTPGAAKVKRKIDGEARFLRGSVTSVTASYREVIRYAVLLIYTSFRGNSLM